MVDDELDLNGLRSRIEQRYKLRAQFRAQLVLFIVVNVIAFFVNYMDYSPLRFNQHDLFPYPLVMTLPWAWTLFKLWRSYATIRERELQAALQRMMRGEEALENTDKAKRKLKAPLRLTDDGELELADGQFPLASETRR